MYILQFFSFYFYLLVILMSVLDFNDIQLFVLQVESLEIPIVSTIRQDDVVDE